MIVEYKDSDMKRIWYLDDVKVGQILGIKSAHRYKDGYWDMWSKELFRVTEKLDDGFKLINLVHEHESLTINGENFSYSSIRVDGILINQVLLRKFKLEKLLNDES